MGNSVVGVSSLFDGFAAVVKVVVWHVFFYHVHDTLPIGSEFSFI